MPFISLLCTHFIGYSFISALSINVLITLVFSAHWVQRKKITEMSLTRVTFGDQQLSFSFSRTPNLNWFEIHTYIQYNIALLKRKDTIFFFFAMVRNWMNCFNGRQVISRFFFSTKRGCFVCKDYLSIWSK